MESNTSKIPGLDSTAEAGTTATDAVYLGALTACASIVASIHFFVHREILLFGDATAHINIARRVFDSRNPGLSQLGTVWLPLPHLLMLPFVLSHQLWQTGIGGSIPSMAAYVAGSIGIFRLVSEFPGPKQLWRPVAWCAAIVYAANPNLLYLQSTAMNEPLYVALFIWATVYFAEFVQTTRIPGMAAKPQRDRALRRCGWSLLAAMLTRYDGWFAAFAFAAAALILVWQWTAGRVALWRSPLFPAFRTFILILAIAPVSWLAYNAAYWKNPLEFATGPYSARAIEARAPRPGWTYPGWHSPKVAILYYMKAVKLNLAPASMANGEAQPAGYLENIFPAVALPGTLLVLIAWKRALWPCLLLWLPLFFYAIMISWGSVPIFVPSWWPYSYYNLRYGIELLPAFAVLGSIAACTAGSDWSSRFSRSPRAAVAGAAAGLLLFLGFALSSYALAWRASPICLQEARANNSGRVLFDQELGRALASLPPASTVLIDMGSRAAALEFAGIPLHRTINETDGKLWRAALAAPSVTADYAVAMESADDPVWRSAQAHLDELQLKSIIQSPGQPRAFLYQRK